jgi:hypothetical protein
MSNRPSRRTVAIIGVERDGEIAPDKRYEPPKLTHIGNARDLLAGATGTVADSGPPALKPAQSGEAPG